MRGKGGILICRWVVRRCWRFEGRGCRFEAGARQLEPSTLGSKDSYFKAFGPKDHTIQGFWAILSLRVGVQGSEFRGLGAEFSSACLWSLVTVPPICCAVIYRRLGRESLVCHGPRLWATLSARMLQRRV